MQKEDAYIIHKCLNGEPEAFGFLVDRYKESVYALAHSKLHDFQDAEDVTQEVFEEIPEENIEYVELTQEALNLARKYIAEGVISESKLADAEHIAIATINRVDILLSWNFHHIVNLKRAKTLQDTVKNT